MSCRFFLLAPYIIKKAHDCYREQRYGGHSLTTGCTTGGELLVFFVFFYFNVKTQVCEDSVDFR